MLELFALNKLSDDPNSPVAKKAMVGGVVVYVLFLIWAIMRAMKCSSANPDSRAIHFMFAFASPLLYIILSYVVPGFHM